MQTYPPDLAVAHWTIAATVASNDASCIVRSPISTSGASAAGGTVTAAPLRILHITKRFWPFDGGVERYVMDVAKEQQKHGHHVRILTIDRDIVSGASLRLPESERLENLVISRVPAVGSARKQFVMGRYGRVLHELRHADVVHHHDPRFLFETAVLVRRIVRKPLIFHTHGMIWHTADFATVKRLAMRWYYGPVLSRCVDAIVAGSQADVDTLVASGSVSRAKVRHLPSGVDLSRFVGVPRSPERGLLMSFGRIDTHKGLDRLLEVLATVTEPWRLAVAGTGHAKIVESLRSQAVGLNIGDRITWLGRVSEDELIDLLARAWVAVFPSRFEGFGLALVEALAAGVPVIASDIPAHRATLGADLADRTVAFDDVAGAAATVDDALRWPSNVAATMSEAARRRGRAFDVSLLAESIDALYVELGVAGGARLGGSESLERESP